VLGSLVAAAQACHDLALAYRMPFISGKDSLKNEFTSAGRHIIIPPTLLISAMGQMADVRQAVTMDLKGVGNSLYLIGTTRDEMAGSHFHLVHGLSGGKVPMPEVTTAPKIFAALHGAICAGLVRACHDLSEGGLAVALAEMAFAGGIGADITNTAAKGLADLVALFSESTTRFVVEIAPDKVKAFEERLAGWITPIGKTVKEPRLRIVDSGGEWIVWANLAQLKEAWQKPLRW
jgi:phosphoribosylformylglycinamidine synthase